MDGSTNITDAGAGGAVMEMAGVSVGELRNPGRLLLADVNWTVRRGEFWAVGGMHGSGKSDLLLMAAGLTAPQAGSYRLLGMDMPIFEGELLDQRLRLGLVFDDGHLFHNLTVRENIALPLRYHRRADWRELEREVDALLNLAGLSGQGNVTAVNLRRDWKKRAGLARALGLRPEVLLLDDPAAGVDMREVQWWTACLRRLWTGDGAAGAAPMTIVVTAEDLRPWRGLANRFALVAEKRFLDIGGAPELERHSQSLVRELLAEPHPGN